jgi:hypothetical protein
MPRNPNRLQLLTGEKSATSRGTVPRTPLVPVGWTSGNVGNKATVIGSTQLSQLPAERENCQIIGLATRNPPSTHASDLSSSESVNRTSSSPVCCRVPTNATDPIGSGDAFAGRLRAYTTVLAWTTHHRNNTNSVSGESQAARAVRSRKTKHAPAFAINSGCVCMCMCVWGD